MDNRGFLFMFFSLQLTTLSPEMLYQKKLEANFFNAIKHEDASTLISYISEKKIDINMLDSIEWTPLHVAIVYHRKNIMLQLLDAGADINKKTIQGTPLSWAILLNQVEIVRLLIQKDVVVTIKDFYQALKQKPQNSDIIKLLGNALRNNHPHNK